MRRKRPKGSKGSKHFSKNAGPRRLKHFAGKAGLSQAHIARKMGKTPSAISKWFTGAGAPTLANLGQVVEMLGIDMATFWAPFPEEQVPRIHAPLPAA